MSCQPSPIQLIDIPIHIQNLSETFASLHAQKHHTAVNFINVHSFMESRNDLALKQAFQSPAAWNAADGVPLQWLARAQGTPISGGRVCGPDFMQMCLSSSDPTYHHMGVIGGTNNQGETLAKKFNKKITQYVTPHRPFNKEHAIEDWEAFVRLCAVEYTAQQQQQIPTYIWVCLGAPKQELWIQAVINYLAKNQNQNTEPNDTYAHHVFLGVGAAIDFQTKTKKRAPRIMQALGLEWLFRLLSEPRRLGMRYLKTNLSFLCLLMRAYFKKAS